MGSYKEKLLAETPRVIPGEQTMGYAVASLTGSRRERRQGSGANDD